MRGYGGGERVSKNNRWGHEQRQGSAGLWRCWGGGGAIWQKKEKTTSRFNLVPYTDLYCRQKSVPSSCLSSALCCLSISWPLLYFFDVFFYSFLALPLSLSIIYLSHVAVCISVMCAKLFRSQWNTIWFNQKDIWGRGTGNHVKSCDKPDLKVQGATALYVDKWDTEKCHLSWTSNNMITNRHQRAHYRGFEGVGAL